MLDEEETDNACEPEKEASEINYANVDRGSGSASSEQIVEEQELLLDKMKAEIENKKAAFAKKRRKIQKIRRAFRAKIAPSEEEKEE